MMIENLETLLSERANLVAEKAQIEDHLETVSKRLTDIEQQEIPDLLLEAGLTKIVTDKGLTVRVDKFYSAKLIEKEEAFNWLDANGYGDIAKREVTVPAANADTAKAVLELLYDAGVEASQDRSIHHKTLASWVKEQIEAGRPIPPSLFNVYIGNKAHIS